MMTDACDQQRNRIVIVGATGSGKTTLARRLAERLHLTLVDLDALFWDPGWTQVPQEVFRGRVDQSLPPGPQGAWVVSGNYHMVRDLVWARADTLLWLDYPLIVVFARLLRRTLARIMNHEELFNGNYETFHHSFLSHNSILLYLFQSYGRLRQSLPGELAQPEYSHLEVVYLKIPDETERWVSGLVKRKIADSASSSIL